MCCDQFSFYLEVSQRHLGPSSNLEQYHISISKENSKDK